ncbi:MAG: helix-turn-helix transcriptional regulator [bacterium]
MSVRCKFFTRPKLKLTIIRSKKQPKGYPVGPKTLGEKIRKKRMDLGLFQKDVAKFVGVVTDTVTLWEKGRKEPSKRYLKRIEQFLKKK